MNKNYYIAKTHEQRLAALEYLSGAHGVIAVDTETTNADPFGCGLLGISFSCKEGEAFYIPTLESLLFDTEVYSFLQEVLLDSRNLLVMHNSVFDVLVLKETLGIDCRDRLHADTILQKHTLDESRPHGLKETAMKYLGAEWGDDREDLKASVLANGGKWTKEEKNFDKADLDILGKYACADADMTLRLYNLFETKLKEQNLQKFFYQEEVMPLNQVVIGMVEKGIKIDVNYYSELKKELEKEAEDLENKVHNEVKTKYNKIYLEMEKELVEAKIPVKSKGSLFEQMYIDDGLPIYNNPKTGNPTFTQVVILDALKENPGKDLLKWRLGLITNEDFVSKYYTTIYATQKKLYMSLSKTKYVININSNDQIADLLFSRLGETAEKKTEKGKIQVDDEILDKFKTKYPFIEYLLQLKKVRKLLSTYVEGALDRHKNGVIRPGWLQFGTESGRFSCVNPNYQNLPRSDKRIKKGIVAREDHVLIGADYSQLEPRCFSHCSNEQNLINAFKQGDDFYGTLAVDLYDLDCKPNEVKEKYPDIRFQVKVAGLATAYGAKKWKLSSILGISINEAERFRDKYFKKYSNLDKYIHRCQGQVLLHGCITNETGRVRHMPDVLKLKGKRDRKSTRELHGMLNLAVNFPIQSLAASIVNRAMIEMTKQFKDRDIDATILMQIHDEIVVEVEEGKALQCHQIMKDVMENNYKLNLPLLAEPVIAKNLAETK